MSEQNDTRHNVIDRIELNNALDRLEDISGGPRDLVEAMEAVEKILDWAIKELQFPRGDTTRGAIEAVLQEAFSEACDREAKFTGRA